MGLRHQIAIGALGAIAVAQLSACGPQTPDRPQIRLSPSDRPAETFHIEVVGLGPGTIARLRAASPSAAQWTATFAVYVGDGLPDRPEIPPVLGSYATLTDRVRFLPRFPLVRGMSYTVLWRSPTSSGGAPPTTLRTVLAVPTLDTGVATEVAAVHPSADVLPENQLKLYLHFSAPMSRGEARRHLHLFEVDGAEVPAPFALIDRELWDPDSTRLTVFFDPGRTKRGVGPNLEVGPPLHEGRAYRLLIDRSWRDAAGQPLRASFEKHFRVIAPDRTRPDPRDWALAPPKARTDPLALVFPEPMDRALLERLLLVVDAKGESVAGTVSVSDRDRRWAFNPNAHWRAGRYELRVDRGLEDLAGNTLQRAFETPVTSTVGAPKVAEAIRLQFRVGS